MLTITENQMFVNSSYTSYLDDIDHKNIIEAVEKIEQEKSSNQFSNAGGYQSPSIYFPNWDNVSTQLLFENHIIPMANHILDEIWSLPTGERKLNYWYNINPKYTYNREHTHPSAYLSGVYYLKVPENSGHIHFLRSPSEIDRMEFMTKIIRGKKFDNNRINTEHWFIPKEGMLILFPGHITHFVERNLTEEADDRRISLSFNFY
jgi:uncharacterized protein (TIGR02466 family)